MGKTILLIVSVLGMALLGCKSRNGVKCDVFELQADRNNGKASVTLNTDLPDSTEIEVTINRSYNVKGNSKEKTLRYFSKNTTVGELKEPNHLTFDNEKWKKKLHKQHNELMKTEDANEIKSIDQAVKVSSVILSDQFGKSNSNLTGEAVKGDKKQIVNSVAKTYYPVHDFFKTPESSKSKTSPYVTITKDVNIHLKPNRNSTVVAQAQKGDIFTLVNITDKWYQIYMFSGEPRYVRKPTAHPTTTALGLPSSAMETCEKIYSAERRSSRIADNKYPNDINKKVDYSRMIVDRFKLSIFHKNNLPPGKYSKLQVKCVKRKRNNY